MIETVKQWWRPRQYHVEFFRGPIGMASWHDPKRFSRMKDAEARLDALASMPDVDVMHELNVNFVPSFMRILEVVSPPPYRRLMNRFKIPLIRFTLFGKRYYI